MNNKDISITNIDSISDIDTACKIDSKAEVGKVFYFHPPNIFNGFPLIVGKASSGKSAFLKLSRQHLINTSSFNK